MSDCFEVPDKNNNLLVHPVSWTFYTDKKLVIGY